MAVAVFLLGLIFGSFSNVVALRWNTGESLVFGGSRCFFCQKRLRWFELLPIASYVIQRGRCRSCGGAISLQYPLVELSSALIFFLLYLSKVEPWLWITSAAFFWLLLVLSVYDIRHQILPDSFVASAAVVAVAIQFGSVGRQAGYFHFDAYRLLTACASGAALFLFFGALWFFSRGRWMGLGDAKLAFAIGIFLGFSRAIVALFLAFWVGAAVGLGWIAVQSLIKKRRASAQVWKTPIPFGPFLAFGAFVAYLWGGALIEWYLRLVI